MISKSHLVMSLVYLFAMVAFGQSPPVSSSTVVPSLRVTFSNDRCTVDRTNVVPGRYMLVIDKMTAKTAGIAMAQRGETIPLFRHEMKPAERIWFRVVELASGRTYDITSSPDGHSCLLEVR